MAGQYVRIIEQSPHRFVNVEGIDRHQITDIPIVTCGASVISKNRGPVIAIFQQYAGIQRGPTIHSSGQLEALDNKVNDRSRKIESAGQLIITNDAFEFPRHIRNGLAYLDMRPFTDAERDKLWSNLRNASSLDPLPMIGTFMREISLRPLVWS